MTAWTAPSVFPAQATSLLGTPASQGGGPSKGKWSWKQDRRHSCPVPAPHGPVVTSCTQTIRLLSSPKSLEVFSPDPDTPWSYIFKVLESPKQGPHPGPELLQKISCRHGHCLVTLLVPCPLSCQASPWHSNPCPFRGTNCPGSAGKPSVPFKSWELSLYLLWVFF